MLKLYNTLTREKETFKPLKKRVGMYTCGPTVYDHAHIGNLRTYIFEDILKRALHYNGYETKHVMNITDVGHLTSDEDEGEDKMEKGARREKKTVWEIAEIYTEKWKKDMRKLNILDPDIWIKATDTIKEQIELIKTLEKKGYAYTIEDGVYFDTSKLPNYGKLANLKKENLKEGARVSPAPGKRNPTDFALWKFSPEDKKREMEWDSPWEKGFPGWHTECVVMSILNLGIPFDIHCGGIDHIPVHHTNEIAQAEAVYGKKMANFWLHGEFLNFKKTKMAKSKGETITLDVLKEKEFSPLDYRYLCLTAHYRSKLNFSFQALQSAKEGLNSLKEKVEEISQEEYTTDTSFQKEFLHHINDDLDTPQALAIAWKVIKSNKLSDKKKYGLLLSFDKIFGLDLHQKTEVPSFVKELAEEREKARKEKDFSKADKVRKEIEKQGYKIEDTPKGYKLKKYE